MRKRFLFAIATSLLLAFMDGAPAIAAGGGQVVGLRRLTEQEYRNSIADIFGKGIVVQGVFEPGKRVGGLIEASTALLSITPVGFDSYSKMADSIAAVDRPKVDAVTSDPARVRNCLVQMGSRKQNEPSGRTNYLYRLAVDRLLRLWLLSSIRLNVLGCFDSTYLIPLCIIINF